MSDFKTRRDAGIEHKLPRIKEGPKGDALTAPLFGSVGLVVSVSESQQCVVLGRRPAVSHKCQQRRTL